MLPLGRRHETLGFDGATTLVFNSTTHSPHGLRLRVIRCQTPAFNNSEPVLARRKKEVVLNLACQIREKSATISNDQVGVSGLEVSSRVRNRRKTLRNARQFREFYLIIGS